MRHRRAPMIYEIDTQVWLSDVARRFGCPARLQDVPKEAWDEVTPPGIDTLWLMGVWQRSPEGRAIALADPELRRGFGDALPGVADDDIAGSPYCVRDYVADEGLGGPEGLAAARAELNRRDIALLLDYVPNHVAPDHPWVAAHPDYFVRGGAADLAGDPAAFLERGGYVYARGRDPFFPPWPDVVQLNAFSQGLRTSTVETLLRIGEHCDGVRCDMAMLMTNEVFARTWGARAGKPPAKDFWPSVIDRVRKRHPGMTFVAEAYWDMEWTLQQQGFDYCYDKRLYDRLLGGDPGSVRAHLTAELPYQRRLVRFLENHDEPRAAGTMHQAKERAAATMIATLPGATLWQEGQFEGRRTRVPVFLARRPDEPVAEGLREFHERLIAAVVSSGMRQGEWRLLDCHGWPDNQSCAGLLAWAWTGPDARHLVVVNLQDRPAQARVPLPWPELPDRQWILRDLLTGAVHERAGDSMHTEGLYVELGGWATHVFTVDPAAP
ncbi:alpha-amylase family glycosyl hydrolase [Nonomuraea monospora]|uniref:Alpha-amylase family glycosyl hydrolase n=1 Tax=Nonomuraea monospora TaxID=568818 RepID=A0ABP5PAY0_9ACTN